MRFDKPAAFQIQSIAYKSHYENLPFEIPESWVWTSIGELFEHNTGKALNASNRDGKMMDYITTSNLYWDRFDLSVVKQMLFTEEELWRCTAKKGDLLICEGGDIGRAAIWNYDYDIRIQNHIHRLRGYKGINHRFYYFVFLLYKLSNRIGGKGVAIQGLSSGDLHKLEVPLPPEYEQIRLVKTIEKWFKFVDLLEQEQENIHTLVQSTKIKILDLAISGKLVLQDPNDEPAIELLKRINPDFQPCDNSHYENLPFEVPDGWCWAKINDVTEFIKNGAQIKQFKGASGIPITRIETISNSELDMARMGYANITNGAEYKDYYIKDGDILMSHINSRAHIGKCALCNVGENQIIHGMNLLRIRCSKQILPEYMVHYFRSTTFYNLIEPHIKNAVNQASINITNLQKILIPIPPYIEQKRVALMVDKLFSTIDTITAEL